jgi:serine/threonine protein kinase
MTADQGRLRSDRWASSGDSADGDSRRGCPPGPGAVPPTMDPAHLPDRGRPAGEASPIVVGDRFGRYRLDRRLGRGGMGEVHLAHDTWLDRRVALKFSLFDPEVDVPETLERFYREARAAATLSHPNLCPVHDVGQVGGVHYMAMAYVEGEPLSLAIEREAPMPPPSAAALVRQMAVALGYAHARGVIHRDLKPSNIMLTPRGEPVIIDFGLARRLDADPRLTKTGTVMGSPHYMPPEQVEGNVRAMGPAGDIYSLGVILYELLTARRPFEGSVGSVLGKILYAEPPLPSAHLPGLDRRIEAVCRKAMSKPIGGRFRSMEEMAEALGACLTSAAPAPRRAPRDRGGRPGKAWWRWPSAGPKIQRPGLL